MEENFVTIKVWTNTKKIAKQLALNRNTSLAQLLNDLVIEVAEKEGELPSLNNGFDEYVYFIQSTNGGNIKIGKSGRPANRLKDLQDMYKDKSLSFIGLIKGGLEKECVIHQQFNHLRQSGEWFLPDETLLEYIKYNTLLINETLTNARIR